MIFTQELSPPLRSFTTGVPRSSKNATRRPRLSGESPEHLPSESLLARTTLAGEREAYSGLIEPAGSHTCHHTPSHTLSIPLNLLYILESPKCQNTKGLFLGLERKHTSFTPRARMHLEQGKLVRSRNSQNSAGRCTLEPFWVENSCF